MYGTSVKQVVSPVFGSIRYRSIFSSFRWSPIQYRKPSFSFQEGFQKFFLDQSSDEMMSPWLMSVLFVRSSITSGLGSSLRR